MNSMLLFGITLINILRSTSLSGSINTDLLLTEATHTVDGETTVAQGVTLTIPTRATLTFMGEYTINVDGTIIIGRDCQNTAQQICDTPGVCYAEVATINSNINSNSSMGNVPQINLRNNAQATICDARVNGIRFSANDNSKYTIDNAEFSNLGYNMGIHQYTYNDYNYTGNIITDTIFNEFYQGISINNGDATINNCQFTMMHDTGIYAQNNVNITGCTFAGDNGGVNGIYFSGYGKISDCIFDNLNYGINAVSNVQIEYNQFTGNNRGVYISTSSQVYVNYNNFINNTYAIYLSGANEQRNLEKNYYDVSNPTSETDIATEIGDICSGASQGFATYWPWYTSTINFNDAKAGTYPTEANLQTVNSPTCIGADNHPEITGNKLKVIYSTSDTLLASNSPYYVVSNVIITSTLTVENGVVIIFAGDYTINVKDGEIMMCGVSSDTVTTPGVIFQTATQVRGDYGNGNNSNSGPFGSIEISNNGRGTFCNVIFNKMKQAIYSQSNVPIMVDNCVFNNSDTAIDLTSSYSYSNRSQISDSIFDNTNYCVYINMETSINNCEFRNFMYDAIQLQGYANDVSNCLIVGDYDTAASNNSMMYGGNCIYMWGGNNNITGNNIKNCYTGIYMRGSQSQITYNTFQNNKLGIDFYSCCSEISVSVNYNNFISNDINMEAPTQYDVNGANYNYYGTTDESVIAATMKDICSGDGSGLITWWPYYVSTVSSGAALPNFNDIVNPTCNGPDNYPGKNPRLNVLYFSDATLIPSQSPYYVTNNVKIRDGATLYIDNGVQLIFMSQYDITVAGAIEVGQCDQTSLSTQGSTRGVLFVQKTVIRGDAAGQQNGCIKITNGNGRFCNTVFQDLQCGVYVDNSDNTNNGTLVDNCDFDNVNEPIRFQSNNGGNEITDSDFIDCGYYCISADGGTRIYNNLISHFEQYGIELQTHNNYDSMDVSFTDIIFTTPVSNNNDSMGMYDPAGIHVYTYAGANITQCTFENLYNGIELNYGGANISWNQFRNNEIGIYYESYYASSIKYNNFDNCTFNIESRVSNDINAIYNWNGNVNDIYSVSDVAAKMKDYCNGCCCCSGRVIFEPYFDSPINIPNEDHSMASLLTFPFTDCADFPSQTSGGATFSPSSSPTVKPPACPTTVGTTYCDQMVTGQIRDGHGESCWQFDKIGNEQVTFSTCGSSIPTSLRVYDSSNNLISNGYCMYQDDQYGADCNSYKCKPDNTYRKQVFTMPGSALPQDTYYVKVGLVDYADGSPDYKLDIICGQTPAPTLPSLTDLTVCDATVDGFVSNYIDDVYFDVGTIGYGDRMAFNACPNNNDGFNMFSFQLKLYAKDSFIDGSLIYKDASDSRGKCGAEAGYGTYLQYTNWDSNYTDSFILQIRSWNRRGGSYKITKECNATGTTSFPTSAPTNLIVTDIINCGQVKQGQIGHGDQIYYQIPFDFSTSCGYTYAFDACPKDNPYVNQIDDLYIRIFEIYNDSKSSNNNTTTTSTATDIAESGSGDGIPKRSLYEYGDVRTGTKYCDINNKNYEPNGYYYQFTDNQCKGGGITNLYLKLEAYIDWDVGQKLDYQIEFKCDTPIITTPSPTLPSNASESISCGNRKQGIYTDSEIYYKLAYNDLNNNNEVAFNGCPSDFDTRLAVYQVCNGCDYLDFQRSRTGSTPLLCNDNQDGTYLIYHPSWYGVYQEYSYYLGIQYDDGSYTGECVDCNYDITMECSNIQHTTGYPTEVYVPTAELSPAPTTVGNAITCSTRDLIGNLQTTQSLRNTYPFNNDKRQFVLFLFCSMANFKSTITLYDEDNNINNKYDIIALSSSSTWNKPGDECQNITGYFDSGDYWLSIEPKYDWDKQIVGLPETGQAKYLLNVYCDTEAITQSNIIPTPKADINNCNYVQISKQKPPIPIGICNTKYSKDPYHDDGDGDGGRYSYKAECKSGNNGLQVTICPNAKTCNANSCFTVDASLESQCKNDATLCDFTVYDYNCQAASICKYTTIRKSAITGNVWDDNFNPNQCIKDDVFYEDITMIIDDCYVKKTYGWTSGMISCNGLNSITIDEYLIPFAIDATDLCSSNSIYKYNSTTILNGECVNGAYIDITYCPYTATPTSNTKSPTITPTFDPTRVGETRKPTPSPTPQPTQNPLRQGETHAPTTTYNDQDTTQHVVQTDSPVASPSPAPTEDTAGIASYYSTVFSLIIGFIAVILLAYQ